MLIRGLYSKPWSIYLFLYYLIALMLLVLILIPTNTHLNRVFMWLCRHFKILFLVYIHLRSLSGSKLFYVWWKRTLNYSCQSWTWFLLYLHGSQVLFILDSLLTLSSDFISRELFVCLSYCSIIFLSRRICQKIFINPCKINRWNCKVWNTAFTVFRIITMQTCTFPDLKSKGFVTWW